MNFYTVRRAIPKLWDLTLDFTLSASNAFLCTYPTHAHTHIHRDRERYTQRNNKYQVPVKSMIELKLIKQLA